MLLIWEKWIDIFIFQKYKYWRSEVAELSANLPNSLALLCQSNQFSPDNNLNFSLFKQSCPKRSSFARLQQYQFFMSQRSFQLCRMNNFHFSMSTKLHHNNRIIPQSAECYIYFSGSLEWKNFVHCHRKFTKEESMQCSIFW